MMYHKILKLEDMQNMTIDQIVNLYREGYNLEDSSIKSIQQTSNVNVESIKQIPDVNIKSMQQTSNYSIIAILFIGFVSSFTASYIFYNYYRKNIRDTNYIR